MSEKLEFDIKNTYFYSWAKDIQEVATSSYFKNSDRNQESVLTGSDVKIIIKYSGDMVILKVRLSYWPFAIYAVRDYTEYHLVSYPWNIPLEKAAEIIRQKYRQVMQGREKATVSDAKYLRDFEIDKCEPDVLYFWVNDETRGYYGGPLPEQNKKVVVVNANHRHKRYIDRLGNFGTSTGKYACWSNTVTIKEDDPDCLQTYTVSANSLIWIADKTQERLNDEITIKKQSMVKISELPETKYAIGDIVQIPAHPKYSADTFVITGIDYSCFDALEEPDEYARPYDLKSIKYSHHLSMLGYQEKDLVLVSRGNNWKWFNNQKDKCTFETIEEELGFYIQIDGYTSVKCPSTGHYGWPVDEALQAARESQVHFVQHPLYLFGAKPDGTVQCGMLKENHNSIIERLQKTYIERDKEDFV